MGISALEKITGLVIVKFMIDHRTKMSAAKLIYTEDNKKTAKVKFLKGIIANSK